MKNSSTSVVPQVPMFALVLVTLLFSGQNAPSAYSEGSVVSRDTRMVSAHMQELATPICDGNRLIHEATNEYRMFYDESYASAQTIADATNRYRELYDQTFISEQKIAASTKQYCFGGDIDAGKQPTN